MGVLEIRLINYYFSEQHDLSNSNINHNLTEKFFDMDIFKDIREKYSDIINPTLHNLKNFSDRPIQEDLNQFKEAIKQEPRLESFLLDVVKCSHENFNAMWKSFYFYDKFLFKHFSELMNSAKRQDKSTLMGIIMNFQELRKADLSLLQKLQSPLEISEVKTEARIKIEGRTFTFQDLDFRRYDIIQMLNQKSLNDQEIIVHNWCEKVGDLIETQFKRVIYFIFLINYLIRKGETYVSDVRFKSLSTNDVLSKFSKRYNKYEYISNLRHIRNSVQHGDFTWESSQPIEHSFIRFNDRNWVKSITFEQLLVQYFKLVVLMSTFELVITNTHLSLLDGSRSIDQILKDVGNQLFKQIANPLREWLKESEDDH